MTDTTSDEEGSEQLINNRQNGRRRGRGGGAPRGNGGNNGAGGNRIDNRARGNASQLYEKYKTLARDSQMQGDRVMTEYYLQFADHYFRVLSETRARFEDQPQRRDRFDGADEDDYEGEADGNAMSGDDRFDDRQPERGQREQRDDYRAERPQQQPHPQQRERGDEQQRDNRRPRDDRRPREERPVVEQAAPEAAPPADQAWEPREERRPRRRPREEAPVPAPVEANGHDVREGFDFDRLPASILPPSFSADIAPASVDADTDVVADVVEEAPKRRRGRPRKDQSVVADA